MAHAARDRGAATLLSRMQHGLFLLLVVIGLVRAVSTGAHLGWIALGVLALLGWYAAGLALARRPDSSGAIWWMVGLTAIWLALVLVSSEFVWVAVSLWLLAGHFLRLAWAIAYTAAVLAVVIGAQHDGRPWGSAMIMGPAVGALFSLALSVGQLRLVRDGIERQRLVDALVAAQAESESLHAELASAQRESGALAERTRLSRDIHDGLAQSFSSILLTARGAQGGTAEDLAAALRQVEASAGEGLDESRRVVAALAPKDLSDTGLAAALRRTLDELERTTGTAADLQVDGDVASLPTTVEVALLRVAQGALANVRQHADASRVVVTLTGSEDSIRLDIVDDGRGFDLACRTTGRDIAVGGYGLQASRDRLRDLGGGLDIETGPGEGTALTAYLPLGGGTA